MQASGDDQHRIWILSGTGEGPPLTRSLLARGWRVQVSVVTDAAALAYWGLPVDQIRIGALDGQAAMAAVLQEDGPFRWVVDATHPFATRVTRDLSEVCARVGQPLLRLERPQPSNGAADLLDHPDGLKLHDLRGRRLLIALGARHLAAAVAAGQAAGAEVFARVLPSTDSLRLARAVGLPADRLAVVRPLQGPSPGALERALCRRWTISDVLCRQSGGETETLWRTVSSEQDLKLWLLRRPQPLLRIETVVGVQALLQRLQHERLQHDGDNHGDSGADHRSG